jgi:predicted Rossmann fold nucleotide-binding protein DprA/Smf involved in DNA uptake
MSCRVLVAGILERSQRPLTIDALVRVTQYPDRTVRKALSTLKFEDRVFALRDGWVARNPLRNSLYRP